MREGVRAPAASLLESQQKNGEQEGEAKRPDAEFPLPEHLQGAKQEQRHKRAQIGGFCNYGARRASRVSGLTPKSSWRCLDSCCQGPLGREGFWWPVSICEGHQPGHTGDVLNTRLCRSECLQLSVPPGPSVHCLCLPLKEKWIYP